MHFLSAVMCQLLSVPFHSFGVTLQNWLLGAAFRASAGLDMKSLILFISLKWKWVWGRAKVLRSSAWKAVLDWLKFADCPGVAQGSGLNLWRHLVYTVTC